MTEKFKTTLFLGGLNADLGLSTLRSYFSQFGTISKISIPGGKKSKGYAFIKYEDSEGLAAALAQTHTIAGRLVNTTQALAPKEARKQTSKKTKKKIFVGGLSAKTSEQDLLDCFSKFGTVVNAYLIWDEVTKKTKKFGFVEFEDEAGANAAQVCNTHNINGRICFSKNQIEQKTKFAQPEATPEVVAHKANNSTDLETKLPSFKTSNSNTVSDDDSSPTKQGPLTKDWSNIEAPLAKNVIYYLEPEPQTLELGYEQPCYEQPCYMNETAIGADPNDGYYYQDCQNYYAQDYYYAPQTVTYEYSDYYYNNQTQQETYPAYYENTHVNYNQYYTNATGQESTMAQAQATYGCYYANQQH
jgi:RNA recognition motif-containing protein